MNSGKIYEFGPYRLDPASLLLTKGEEAVSLPPKAAQALVVLVQNQGRVVGKDDLLKAVWLDTFVEESSLTQTISVLRKALGEGHERYIETLPKRGYRFVVRVELRSPAGESVAPAPVDADADRNTFRWLGIAVLVCMAVGATLFLLRDRIWPREPRIMLAVLPFENVSSDPNERFFCDGLTEEMITLLGRLSPDRLGVIARISVNRYRVTQKGIGEIGRELGVDYVIEGSVRREGPRVRVAARLIRVLDQTHLWAETYERSASEILKVQGNIAEAVAQGIQVKLMPGSAVRLAKNRQIGPEVYETYLKAMAQPLPKKADLLLQAIHLDGQFTPAYEALARTYFLLGLFSILPPNEAFPKAKEAANRALALDRFSAAAYGWLAASKIHYDWDFADGERLLNRALELNPSNPEAREGYSHYLLWSGRADRSAEESRRAVEIDPFDSGLRVCVAWHGIFAGDYKEVIAAAQRALHQDPQVSGFAHMIMGQAYCEQSRYEEAIAALQKAGDATSLVYTYGVAGKRAQAEQALSVLQERARQRYVPAYNFAVAYAGLSDKNKALEWLEKAYEERSSNLITLRSDPRLKTLRGDPRFAAIVRRLRMPG